MLQVIAKRPETYTELLSRGFNLYRHAFKPTFLLAFILALITFSPRLLFYFSDYSIWQETYSWPLFLGLAGIYILFIWTLSANFWHMHCLYKNRKDSFLIDFKTAGRRVLYVFITALFLFVVMSLLVWVTSSFFFFLKNHGLLDTDNSEKLFFGSTLLFLETLFVCYIPLLFYFYLPLIVVRNEKPWASLIDSAQLSFGHILKIVKLQFTPWAFYWGTLVLIKILTGLDLHVYLMADDESMTLWPMLIQVILFALFVPWSIATVVVQLHDLELRKAAKKK